MPNAWSMRLALTSQFLFFGCAEGTTVTTDEFNLDPASGGATLGWAAGGNVEPHDKGGGGTSLGTGGDTESGGSNSAGGGEVALGGDTSHSGGEGAGGEATGGTGPSEIEPCDFDGVNSCASATQLSDVDGDAGSDVRTAKGTTSKWFEVFVTEAVSDIFYHPDLSFTATLTSPPAMNYDLYVYVGDNGGPNCNDAPTKGVGTPPSVTMVWADTPIIDDGTWVTFEVRYKSGSNCSDDDEWTLRVDGNSGP